jgi:hypothetical protein
MLEEKNTKRPKIKIKTKGKSQYFLKKIINFLKLKEEKNISLRTVKKKVKIIKRRKVKIFKKSKELYMEPNKEISKGIKKIPVKRKNQIKTSRIFFQDKFRFFLKSIFFISKL